MPTGPPAGADGTGRQAAADLIDLRSHWDQAYEISCTPQTWAARLLADTTVLCVGSAGELRELIRRDHVDRTARRRSAGAYGPGERALRALIDDGAI